MSKKKRGRQEQPAPSTSLFALMALADQRAFFLALRFVVGGDIERGAVEFVEEAARVNQLIVNPDSAEELLRHTQAVACTMLQLLAEQRPTECQELYRQACELRAWEEMHEDVDQDALIAEARRRGLVR